MPGQRQTLDSLDVAQRAVVEALEGPVVIYAGAGSGKTRAITHRIAHGCNQKIYDPQKVLAVTFTTRAADEMSLRLSALGIRNVATRTFHSAALRQLKYFWPKAIGGEIPKVIENKFKDKNGNEQAVSVATTMDMSIIRDLFRNLIEASEILDIDKEFRAILIAKQSKLYPLQIGKNGALMEWYKDFEEEEIQSFSNSSSISDSTIKNSISSISTE